MTRSKIIKITGLLLSLTLIGCQQETDNTKTKQTSTLPTRAENLITVNSLTQHIKTLASDEFGGRGPATPGEILTINYIEEEFKKAGVKPGNGDSYTQKVPLASI